MKSFWKTAVHPLYIVGLFLAAGGLVAYFSRDLRAVVRHWSARQRATSPENGMRHDDSQDIVRRSGSDALVLSDHIAEKMGLRTAAANVAKTAITLPSFQGVLALDSDRLSRSSTRGSAAKWWRWAS